MYRCNPAAVAAVSMVSIYLLQTAGRRFVIGGKEEK